MKVKEFCFPLFLCPVLPGTGGMCPCKTFDTFLSYTNAPLAEQFWTLVRSSSSASTTHGAGHCSSPKLPAAWEVESANWHCQASSVSPREGLGKLELAYLMSVITLYPRGRDAN